MLVYEGPEGVRWELENGFYAIGQDQKTIENRNGIASDLTPMGMHLGNEIKSKFELGNWSRASLQDHDNRQVLGITNKTNDAPPAHLWYKMLGK